MLLQIPEKVSRDVQLDKADYSTMQNLCLPTHNPLKMLFIVRARTSTYSQSYSPLLLKMITSKVANEFILFQCR